MNFLYKILKDIFIRLCIIGRFNINLKIQKYLVMDSKKKNMANEPAESYEVMQKNDAVQKELHPVLTALLEKSIQEANEGKLIPHEEVMKRMKEKFPFLK